MNTEYLAWLSRERLKLDAAIEREIERIMLESELTVVLYEVYKLLGMSYTDAFMRACEEAAKLADV